MKHKHILLLLIKLSYPVGVCARATATLLPAPRSTPSPLDRRAALPHSKKRQRLDSPLGGGYPGFLFSGGFPSTGWFWFLGFDPVILFTVVVAPTTCSLLLVLLLVGVTRFGTRIGGVLPVWYKTTTFLSYPFGTGKLPRITQACGNRRFAASDDPGWWWDTLEFRPQRKAR